MQRRGLNQKKGEDLTSASRMRRRKGTRRGPCSLHELGNPRKKGGRILSSGAATQEGEEREAEFPEHAGSATIF